MLYFLFCLFYVLVNKISSAEVITLIKDNNITCVLSENAAFSGLYITDAVSNEFGHKLIEILNGTVMSDDWNIKSSKHSLHGPVIDERWTSFKCNHIVPVTDEVYSFSIYTKGNNNITIEVQSKDYKKEKKINLSEYITNCGDKQFCHQWIHAIIRKNKSLEICEGNKYKTIKINFVPFAVVTDDTVFKLHDYFFQYNTTVSSQKPPRYPLFFSNNSCVEMFVSVDENCTLEIILESDASAIPQKILADDFNKRDSLRRWQRVKLKTNFVGKVYLSFLRKRTDSKTTGYWAVDDIHFCRKDDIDIYHTSNSTSNTHLCEVLDISEPQMPVDNIFCNKTGYFGTNCNISCSRVLGKSDPYCENYKICASDRICRCAWGYRGPLCTEKCRQPHWGLNCSSLCESQCEICDHAKGCIKSVENYSGVISSDISTTLHSSTETSTISSGNTPNILAPEVPQDVRIYLDSIFDTPMIKLLWSYPDFRNGSLKEFEITVRNNTSVVNYHLPVKDYGEEYHYKIFVEYMQEYFISVCGINHVNESKNITLNATLIHFVVKHLSVPLMETCSTSCVLMIPNIYNYDENLEILVVKRNISNTSTSNLKNMHDSIKKKIKSKEEGWILKLPHTKADNLQLEIGGTVEKAVSLKNQTYIMYLSLFNNATKQYNFYPLEHTTQSEVAKAKHSIFFIILFVNIFLIILVVGTIYYFKYKRSACTTQNVNQQAEAELLPRNNRFSELKNFENDLRNALANKDLVNQFQSLSEAITKPTSVALQRKNNNKNKDRHNVPYDCSRVVLEEMEGVGSDDYINACYIDGYDRLKAYIACQGPKFSTVKDFWRMIWQENVETIIMATNLIENGKRMCAEYWPQTLNTIYECGEMTIKLTKEAFHEHYDTRVFEIYYTSGNRRILHLHLKWDSNRDLFYPNEAVAVVKRIREVYESSDKPIVIHSGFGANRTGVLVLCELALQMAKTENKIDFYVLLAKMREQRPNMVGSLRQYILAHLIVLECIIEEEYLFKNSVAENMHPAAINQQLKYLERLCWLDTIVYSSVLQNKPVNNCFYPVLDGYGKSGKYLITKQPMPQDVVGFWTTIAKESIRYIVFLNKTKSNDEVQLWPSRNVISGMIIKIGKRKVTVTSHFTLTELFLLAHETSSRKVIHENIIFFFELHGWKPKEIVPKSTNNIVKLGNDINKILRTENRILVACKTGFRASGLFSALSYSLEKYEKELEVDVLNAVRIVRRSGAQFVNSSRQIQFIYACILDYLKNFDSYQCIEE